MSEKPNLVNAGSGEFGYFLVDTTATSNQTIGVISFIPDIEHICECVNACAGMKDPEAEIQGLKDALEATVKVGQEQEIEIMQLEETIRSLEDSILLLRKEIENRKPFGL